MRAVPVEVVGRDVEQHADARRERRRQLDLERRHLDDVDAAVGGGSSSRIGGADVAAHLRVVAGLPRRMWAISAVVVDLPLVPVMATNGASGACAGPLAAEQLDVADDLDARGPAPSPPSSAARDGSAARRAPAPAPRNSSSHRPSQVDDGDALASRRLRHAVEPSSQATTSAPPASSAWHVASPEPPQPEHRTILPAEQMRRPCAFSAVIARSDS